MFRDKGRDILCFYILRFFLFAGGIALSFFCKFAPFFLIYRRLEISTSFCKCLSLNDLQPPSRAKRSRERFWRRRARFASKCAKTGSAAPSSRVGAKTGAPNAESSLCGRRAIHIRANLSRGGRPIRAFHRLQFHLRRLRN